MAAAPSSPSRHQALLIFTMGRVGSTAVYRACVAANPTWPVLHVHHLRRSAVQAQVAVATAAGKSYDNLKHAQQALDHILPTSRCIKIVHMVRDPVARTLSHFFKNFGAQWAEPPPPADFLRLGAHDEIRTWLPQEFEPVTGINLFSQPFDPQAGYGVVQQGRFVVLTMQAELSDRRKRSILSDFVGQPVPPLERANRTHGPSIPLPDTYLSKAYATPWAQHFYSQSQRDRFADAWRQPPP